MDTAIYTLTSELHDPQVVAAATREFLGNLGLEHDMRGSDYTDYGSHALDLIYVRTGGTEGIFRRLLPELRAKSGRPFRLLTSGKSNSLAASMEILSYLRQNGLEGEIIHGSREYVASRIELLRRAGKTRMNLRGCRLGVIGEPSDWLISSHADREVLRERLGIELTDISMQELIDTIAMTETGAAPEIQASEEVKRSLPGALRIYVALKKLVQQHGLQGFTLRCFDLLSKVHNTGCVALARLNAEGYVAGCEGDVPAMLSMMIGRSALGVSGFQSNPATIDPVSGRILMAHCTIPLDMVERYELDTHFESGIGVAIRGYMKEGPVTLFKVAGDLSRWFAAEGRLLYNQAEPDLCRTQQFIEFDDPSQTAYFLNNPIGNHHIVLPGRHKDLLEEVLR